MDNKTALTEAAGRLDLMEIGDLAYLAKSLDSERIAVRRKDRGRYAKAIGRVNDAIEEMNRYQAGTKFAGLRRLRTQQAT